MSDPKPLEDAERRLAEAAARVIARAAEVDLSDAPDELVPHHAICLLARAHVALTDDVRAIHDRIDQIARAAIEGALREVARQQGGIATAQVVDEATSAGMLAARPLVTALPQRPPDWTEAPSGPRLVRSADDLAELSEADLLAIYCRAMHETEGAIAEHDRFVVRVWDGMDGCWIDCTGDVDRDAALRCWAEKTDGGARHVAYAEIDYYRIFPSGSRMMWDGSEGREMHR